MSDVINPPLNTADIISSVRYAAAANFNQDPRFSLLSEPTQ